LDSAGTLDDHPMALLFKPWKHNETETLPEFRVFMIPREHVIRSKNGADARNGDQCSGATEARDEILWPGLLGFSNLICPHDPDY
jgi:hypothetical protein